MPTGFTTVSAQHLQDATGAPISNASISFLPVDNRGVPLSFRTGGTEGQVISQAVTATVTDGAFSLTLADTSLTTPVNVGYRITVTDNVSGHVLLTNGYGCVQPTGDAWSLDTYIPNLANQITVQAGPAGKSLNFRGAYDATAIYHYLDVVDAGAYRAVCIVDYNTSYGPYDVGITPSPSAQWTYLARDGAGLSQNDLNLTLAGSTSGSSTSTAGTVTPTAQDQAGDTFIVAIEPFAVGGALTSVSKAFTSATGGQATIVILTQNSNSAYTVTDSFTVTVPASGSRLAKTWSVANGDFTARDVQQGQVFALYCPTSVAHLEYNNSAGGGIMYTSGASVFSAGTVINGTYQGNCGAEMSATVALSTVQAPAADPEGYVGNSALDAKVEAKITSHFAGTAFATATSIRQMLGLPVTGSPIVAIGSSITGGYTLYDTHGSCWFGLLSASVWGSPATCYNVGVPGQTSDGNYKQYMGTASNPGMTSGQSPHSVSPAQNGNAAPGWLLYDLTELTNDYNTYASAGMAYAETVTASVANVTKTLNQAKTDGYKRVLLTSPIRGNGSLNTQPKGGVNATQAQFHLDCYAALRATAGLYEQWIDVSNVISDQSNSAFYNDGTHPNVQGHFALFQAILPAMMTGGSVSNWTP